MGCVGLEALGLVDRLPLAGPGFRPPQLAYPSPPGRRRAASSEAVGVPRTHTNKTCTVQNSPKRPSRPAYGTLGRGAVCLNHPASLLLLRLASPADCSVSPSPFFSQGPPAPIAADWARRWFCCSSASVAFLGPPWHDASSPPCFPHFPSFKNSCWPPPA
ncbi:hypothetical protein COCVIDRAFT_40552 [Bipolaris victoriae FI3]|uniref:Uncharacterized protein n=2 Tax=Bipolaris TaxID=33194 RepID=W6YIU1_COCC2|nr:uncharacterized protein COCCADRAFT_31947 [Bipolaris zeicola 26-R-13]XP_014553423.1 hypothetical protein COCVIDRAFT_40552 [Bipolaris victoriae FI3]EUC39232.1 hypothetical protein COCCADRAFT_31947 [Bipolaris zeicola 26-R-13]